MDRRSFFKRTAGVVAAPFVVKMLPAIPGPVKKKKIEKKAPDVEFDSEYAFNTTIRLKIENGLGIPIAQHEAEAVTLKIIEPDNKTEEYLMKYVWDGVYEAVVNLEKSGIHGFRASRKIGNETVVFYQGNFTVDAPTGRLGFHMTI